MMSLTDVFSQSCRSIRAPAFARRKNLRPPWIASWTVKAPTLPRNFCLRIGVFKSRGARATHQFSGPERFVLAEITIDLPLTKTAPSIHDFPAGAAEDALHLRRSEEHTSELQSRFGISYAVFCLKKTQ